MNSYYLGKEKNSEGQNSNCNGAYIHDGGRVDISPFDQKGRSMKPRITITDCSFHNKSFNL